MNSGQQDFIGGFIGLGFALMVFGVLYETGLLLHLASPIIFVVGLFAIAWVLDSIPYKPNYTPNPKLSKTDDFDKRLAAAMKRNKQRGSV